MLDFSRVQNYYIACGYTDMRKQIDGLVAVVELQFKQKLNETSVPTEQLLLFPETNPILDALRDLDVDNLSPIEAINMLYTWKHKFE